MATCDECGSHEELPYQCRRCGETFCADHRLPENHDCPGLDEWNDPRGLFDDDGDEGTAGGRADDVRARVDDVWGYFRGNVAYAVLALMWVTFALEWLTLVLFGREAFSALFVLRSDHPFRVWTWVTSVFAHSPGNFLHIVGNSIVIYFFGPLVERYVGSKRFAALFVGAGVVAGLGHVTSHLVFAELGMFGTAGVTGVLGASGAAFAILGVLTVLNPDLRVYLWFLLPVPIWLFTLGFAGLSVVFFISPSASQAAGQSNVAHFAHLAGLAVGLAYGKQVKGSGSVPNRLTFGPGRGGGGGGGGGRRRGPGGPGGGRF